MIPEKQVERALPEHDPITIEIIQSSLKAITDEMFATMRKTAVSSIIYEVLDFGVALFDKNGELASSGSGIPAFVGMLEPGVKRMITSFGYENIHPGDMFMTNIPHEGGVSHLNDVVLVLPIFYGGEVVAWVANKAHWVDLGGSFPGSISPDATEIYQEGLQLPAIKIFSEGQLNRAVLDIIAKNSRVPRITMGDFWAGASSLRAGERRVLDLIGKYSVHTVLHAIEDYIALGEKMAREELRRLPKGRHAASETLEDGRVIKAAVTISDEAFIVDLRGNPQQGKNAMNSSREASMADAQMLFKAISNPQSFANAGSFRPISLLVDEGSVFAATYPTAMSTYYEMSILLFDLLWKALAPAMKDRLPAGHYASICGTFMGGPHPQSGRRHSIVEPQLGGWGATHERDGIDALYTGFHGDTFNCPVEITEQRNGLMVDRFCLNEADGGEGHYRGGKGICLDYRVLRDDWWLTMYYVRSQTGPWGLEGGLRGSTNYVEVVRNKDKSSKRYASCAALPLQTGDVVKVHSAVGGGYGDPKLRPKEKIRNDIKNGYITRERARAVYGYSD